jgi:hypothetical protein
MVSNTLDASLGLKSIAKRQPFVISLQELPIFVWETLDRKLGEAQAIFAACPLIGMHTLNVVHGGRAVAKFGKKSCRRAFR